MCLQYSYKKSKLPKAIFRTLEETLDPNDMPWKDCPDQLLDLCACSFNAISNRKSYIDLAIWSLEQLWVASRSGQSHKKVFEGLFQKGIVTSIFRFAFTGEFSRDSENFLASYLQANAAG